MSFTRFRFDVTVLNLLCCCGFAYSTAGKDVIVITSFIIQCISVLLFFFLIANQYVNWIRALTKKKKEEIQVSFLRPSVLNKQGRLYNYMSTCDLKDNLLYRLQRLAVTLYFCMQICVPPLPSSSSWVILCRSLCHPLIIFFEGLLIAKYCFSWKYSTDTTLF